MADKMLWNKEQDASVKASKIRNFSVALQTQFRLPEQEQYGVYGWYNSNEYFFFGEFHGKDVALEFLQGIHDYIEE